MSSLLCPECVPAAEVARAVEVCERIAAKDRSNLYFASQFFEERARYEAFISMYAVMRLIDDCVDEIPDKADARRDVKARLRAELDQWRTRILDAYELRPSTDPVDVALCAALYTFPIPKRMWMNFIEAMLYDVDHPRFEHYSDFLLYGEGATVAPTVIYVYLLTATRDSEGRYRADGFDYETCGRELGMFAYLAHILRDVKRDMMIGKTGLVYLSLEDLEKHGLNEQYLRDLITRATEDARWTALVRDLCSRAHALEERGVRLAEKHYRNMRPDCAFILCLIIGVYKRLLHRIETTPHVVFLSQPVLLPLEVLQIALRAAGSTGYPRLKVIKKLGRRALALLTNRLIPNFGVTDRHDI